MINLNGLKVKVKKLLRRGKLGALERDIDALSAFVKQVRNPKDLEIGEAKGNIERGLVEIVYSNGQHSSNGLLVTDNGYFLTAKHCLEDNWKIKRITCESGKSYRIEKVCVEDKKNDITLAKAQIPETAHPREYRFYRNGGMRPGNSVLAISKWGKRVEYEASMLRQTGVELIDPESRNKVFSTNAFLFNRITVNGDSGGVILDPLAMRIVGLHVGASGKGGAYSCGIEIHRATEMIKHYIKYLEGKLS